MGWKHSFHGLGVALKDVKKKTLENGSDHATGETAGKLEGKGRQGQK